MFDRLVSTWRRVLALAWPVMAEQTLRTLMRTVDVLVTATFSPAAVVAVGLADLYGRIPLRLGLGLGSAAIALASQDTGAGAAANRDEAISAALVIGVLAGIPVGLAGIFFGVPLIGLFGADAETAALGATYLSIVLATAPARHTSIITARALQGTGDTRTPMYVNLVANALNITGSLTLGLGLLGLPRLGVTGVAAATAAANVLSALLLVATTYTARTPTQLVRPTDTRIARQLVVVATPKIAEGFTSTIAEFPFNAILLGFGTPVNAGFQIGRRVYQQVTGPLSRGYRTAVSVLVGQALGDADSDEARYLGWSVTLLGALTVGAVGLLTAAYADALVTLLAAGSPDALPYAADFARVYGLTAGFVVAYTVLSGALGGASETRIPFAARLTGVFGGMLGLTYLLGVHLDWGPLGAYIGIGAQYAWMALVAALGFRYSDWATRAADMMAARGSTSDD